MSHAVGDRLANDPQQWTALDVVHLDACVEIEAQARTGTGGELLRNLGELERERIFVASVQGGNRVA